MSEAKRRAKRFKRENRDNKGVNTEAKRQAYNSRVRAARDTMGGWDTPNEGMLLLAASLMGRKR